MLHILIVLLVAFTVDYQFALWLNVLIVLINFTKDGIFFRGIFCWAILYTLNIYQYI